MLRRPKILLVLEVYRGIGRVIVIFIVVYVRVNWIYVAVRRAILLRRVVARPSPVTLVIVTPI